MATKTVEPRDVSQDEDLGEETPSMSMAIGNMLNGTGGAPAANLGGIDLSKASSGFALLPENEDTLFLIEKIVASIAATSKNPMLTLTLAAEGTNIKIIDYVVYGGDNPWKFKSMCEATGLLSDDGSAFTGSSERDFIGKHIVARVKHDVYQGDKRNKIQGGYKKPNTDTEGDEPDF